MMEMLTDIQERDRRLQQQEERARKQLLSMRRIEIQTWISEMNMFASKLAALRLAIRRTREVDEATIEKVQAGLQRAYRELAATIVYADRSLSSEQQQ